MANFDYYLGPYEWIDDAEEGTFWQPPGGTRGAVDLGAREHFDRPGSSRSIGFFAVDPAQSLPSEYVLLASGDLREINSSGDIQSIWESLLGYRPQGDLLVDLLWDQLTTGSDPDWVDATKPLMPRVNGTLELVLGGHSRIKSERFRFGTHPHTDRVKTLLQRDYQRLHDADANHARKVLDYWLTKYRLSHEDRSQWEQLIPPHLRRGHGGPLTRATMFTDDFNRAELGADWLAIQGTWQIMSNELEYAGGAGNPFATVRYEQDLDSEDHYTQITSLTTEAWNYETGPMCRFAGSSGSEDGYAAQQSDSSNKTRRLVKVVSGTNSVLAFDTNAESFPQTLKVEADGSTIRHYDDGELIFEVTDTGVTGNVRGGVTADHSSSSSTFDNYESADLEVAPEPIESDLGVLFDGASDEVLPAISTGGILLDGQLEIIEPFIADLGVLLGGSAPQVPVEEAYGGALLDGSAVVVEPIESYFGILFDGTADEVLPEESVGGILFDGLSSVDILIPSVSGGILLDGADALLFPEEMAGGILLDGEAIITLPGLDIIAETFHALYSDTLREGVEGTLLSSDLFGIYTSHDLLGK